MSDWQQVTELSGAHIGQTIEVEVRTESLRYGFGTSTRGVRVTGPLEQLTCRAYAGGTPNFVDIRIDGLPMELSIPAQNKFRVVV